MHAGSIMHARESFKQHPTYATHVDTEAETRHILVWQHVELADIAETHTQGLDKA